MSGNDTSRLVELHEVNKRLIEHDETTMKQLSVVVIVVAVISYVLGFLVGRVSHL